MRWEEEFDLFGSIDCLTSRCESHAWLRQSLCTIIAIYAAQCGHEGHGQMLPKSSLNSSMSLVITRCCYDSSMFAE
jgi:hypothetical protein